MTSKPKDYAEESGTRPPDNVGVETVWRERVVLYDAKGRPLTRPIGFRPATRKPE